MELFDFFRGLFAWTATVACLWPVNIPMAALAYKIRNGAKQIDMEGDEFWWRATVASFMLALATAGFIFLDWFIADSLGFPAGMVHLALFMAYVPAAVWVTTLFFGFSDLTDGLSTFTIYILIPMMVLWIFNAITGLWAPLLAFAYTWLKPVTS